jgi:predicted ATP-grasp superfamily ATP-dependent carboligase
MATHRRATPRVAVLEYLCGGGLSQSVTPTATLRALFAEGMSMLAAITSDLTKCQIEVTTVLDRKVLEPAESQPHGAQSHPLAEQVNIVFLTTEDWLNEWRSVASSVDVTLVIAPEIDNELLRVVEYLRVAGCDVQVSSSSFITKTSDKADFSQSLPTTVSHPKTWLVSELLEKPHAIAKVEGDVSLGTEGWVLKSRDGAGCCGMSWFSSLADVSNAMEIRDEIRNSPDRWILQPWLTGEHASLAVLCDSSQSFSLLGACSQRIDRREQVSYTGGSGPILRNDYGVLEEFVKRILSGIPGAKGWIGVDFLYRTRGVGSIRLEDLLVMEVNPRLTTSYLAYRQWYGPELALGVLGLAEDHEWNYSALPTSPLEFTVD